MSASLSSLFDGMRVSEVFLEATAEGGPAELEAADPTQPIFVIGASTPPPVRMQGLHLHGSVRINSPMTITHHFSNCTFDGSGLPSPVAGSVGGALEVQAGVVEVDGCELRHFEVGEGGGLALTGPEASATVKHSRIVHNHATSKGGGLFVDGGRLTLVAATVSDNSAELEGGGLYERLTQCMHSPMCMHPMH